MTGVGKVKIRRSGLAILPLVLLVVVWSVVQLGTVPSIWFDEGWALSLARNWVELGHYGHLQLGEPVPATILNTGFPAIGPIALSFRLFGVGMWQGRLSGLLYTLGALSAIYYIAFKLYGRPVAIATVLTALFLPGHPDLHPILLGRQALGEMPAVFYLLTGFFTLLAAWDKPPWVLAIPSLLWALALNTKPQVLPFLILSFGVTLAVLLLRRRRQAARRLLLLLLLTLTLNRAFDWLWSSYVQDHVLSDESSTNAYGMVSDARNILTYVVVPNLHVRSDAFLGLLCLVGMTGLVGLVWSGLRLYRGVWTDSYDSGRSVVELMLWVVAAGWYLWYQLLSIGWPRYLFPGAFLASIYFAAFLGDLSGNFDVHGTLVKGSRILAGGRLAKESLGITLTIVLVVVTCVTTVSMLWGSYGTADDALSQVAEYLDSQTEPDAMVETYESELFFLLDRTYHFPPDEVQHILNRRAFLKENLPVDYDPLQWDPDYLVLGPFNIRWGLYDSVVAQGDFGLVFQAGHYQVYRRVR